MGKLVFFIIGVLALATWRFATYHPTSVHYHANFAVYVNGQRESFAADSYYEGVSNCYADEANAPTERAHLHDHVNDIVHVEDSAVTWGQFFQNLGWGTGSNYIQTSDKLLVASASHPITYMLNGKPVDNPAGLVIRSLDKLLVSYGMTSKAKLQTQTQSISDSAGVANTTPDPESCSGSAQATWKNRLEHTFQ